ncbi:MAG: nuclear transport factor 2 family protein [Lysobacteraceae bacterium]
MTYLKSAPGKLGQLERYVRANWFAMDKIAVERGLFVSYLWLDTGSDEGPWNAVVMVTYRDAQGFAGIEQEWAGIKAAHREVLIDGAKQADLGRVVESREFFERAPFVNVVAAGNPAEGAASDADSRDESAIREVVGKYFEAGITGSPELIREAFLPTARIEGLRGGRLGTWSFDEYIRFFNGTPASGADQVERTITRVLTHGDSAAVQLRLRFSPAQALDEQLLLFRIDGLWKIAYKSYTPSR